MKLPWHTITIWALLLLAAWQQYQISNLKDDAIDAYNTAEDARSDANEALLALESLQQHPHGLKNGI